MTYTEVLLLFVPANTNVCFMRMRSMTLPPSAVALCILTSCASAEFTPYTGAQQDWPTAPGAFVQSVEAGIGPMSEGGRYKLPVYFGPPNRPYRVIGMLDAESGNLAMWQSGKIEALRPAVKIAARNGADALIVLGQGTETRGYSTTGFAQGQSDTQFNAFGYGNSVYGTANTTASAWGSAFTTPNRRGKARVLAIKFL